MRVRLLGIGLAVVGLGGAGAFACGEDDTTPAVPPITGIVVRAETLTAGRGCGTGVSQVYKTAAVVYGVDPGHVSTDPTAFNTIVTANVYDCFTDVTFERLPASADGSFSYRLELYVFDAAAFSASSAAITGAIDNLAPPIAADTNVLRSDDGGLAALPPDVLTLRGAHPILTTECSATQQDEVEVIAICGPLGVGLDGLDGGLTPPTQVLVPTDSFTFADGGAAIGCAAPPLAPDGGDGGDDDGAAPVPTGPGFVDVRLRVRSGGAFGPTLIRPCPAAFSIDAVQPFAHYDVDVAPLAADGTPFGVTVCSGDALPGASTTASCAPLTSP